MIRTTLVALAVAPVIAAAHHSTAEYDPAVLQELEGQVDRVAWINPHVRVWLRAIDEDGIEAVWDLEARAANNLNRAGLSGDLIRVGDILRVAGNPSTRRPHHMSITNVLLPDGTELRTRDEVGPLWSSDLVGFGDQNIAPVVEEPGDPDGIFRVWTVAERARNSTLPLTAEARSAKDSWDSVTDNAQAGCQPIGMPGAMYSPHPIEFLRQGDDILMRLEEWDAQRLIHMTASSGAQTGPSSHLGHSVGRWENDTLVVTTTNIAYPYMDEFGTPQSDSVEVVERFTLTDDRRSLRWEATVTDPVTMSEPAVAFTARWRWVPGIALQPYNCVDE